MKITPVPFTLDLSVNTGDPRGEGLHASDIYGELFRELEPARYGKGLPPDTIRMAVGMAWEQFLERVLRFHGELVLRPGELSSPEGILYSPDLLVVGKHLDRIGEIKVTWMSSKYKVNKKIWKEVDLSHPKFAKYLAQGMLYAHWSELTGVRYYILFMNGDWKGAHDPVFKVWDVDFTKQELRENYQMHMNYARHKGFFKPGFTRRMR